MALVYVTGDSRFESQLCYATGLATPHMTILRSDRSDSLDIFQKAEAMEKTWTASRGVFHRRISHQFALGMEDRGDSSHHEFVTINGYVRVCGHSTEKHTDE